MPLALAVMLLLAQGAFAEEPARLLLKAQVVVECESVRLADLVEPVEAPSEGLRAILNTSLATLAPGGARTLTPGHIRLLMRQARLNPSAVALAGAAQVRVTRQSAGSAEAGCPGLTVPSPETRAPLIQRGSRVRVKVRIGALAVEADGELMESCRIGATARLRINETRALVTGVLVAPGVAEVVL